MARVGVAIRRCSFGSTQVPLKIGNARDADHGKVRMVPDESGRFFWADCALGLVASLTQQQSGNYGSGGELWNQSPLRIVLG